MQRVEMLRQYLQSRFGPVRIDILEKTPGSLGLFPLTGEEDPLSGRVIRRFLLRRRAVAGEDSARFLPELKDAARTAALGEGFCGLTVEKGQLAKTADTLGIYEAELTAVWLAPDSQASAYRIDGKALPPARVETALKPRQLVKDGAGLLHALPGNTACRWVFSYESLPAADYERLAAALPREGSLLLTHPDPCHPGAVTVSRARVTEFCPGSLSGGIYYNTTLVIEM